MKDVIEFETRLAEITMPADERRDEEKLYNNMAVANLQELAPFVSSHIKYHFDFLLCTLITTIYIYYLLGRNV